MLTKSFTAIGDLENLLSTNGLASGFPRKMDISVRQRIVDWFQIVVTVTSILLGALLIRRKARNLRKRLPPGPPGWPVIGSLLALGKQPPHVSFYNLSKKYGPLMFMHLGSRPVLVVSSPEMARLVLKTHDQTMGSRRTKNLHASSTILSYNGITIGTSNGPHWRFLRKICMVELFTASRLNEFRDMRQGEVKSILHSIVQNTQQGKATGMFDIFSTFAMNNITQMTMNKSYCIANGRSTSIEGKVFREMVREIMILIGAPNIADSISFLSPFDPQGRKKQAEDLHQRMDKYLENILDEHRRKQSSIENLEKSNEDFVDLLLAVSKGEKFEEHLSDNSIKGILLNMIMGGADTISTTLEWTVAELLKHPSSMKRAQEELDVVVGPDRLVDEADIPHLKYLQQVVKEGFRLHPPAPLLLTRESTEECEIAGYHIPAGVMIHVNVWAIQRDPQVWERPLEFDPDRFLNSTKDFKGNDFELLPFGSGRRICPAINLGSLAVHFVLAQLLHTFDWALPDDQEREALDMSESFGLVLPKAVPLMGMAKARLAAHVICPPQPA